jgi:hypothetical protein
VVGPSKRNISLLVAKQYKFANRELPQLPSIGRWMRVEKRQMIDKYPAIGAALGETWIVYPRRSSSGTPQ